MDAAQAGVSLTTTVCHDGGGDHTDEPPTCAHDPVVRGARDPLWNHFSHTCNTVPTYHFC
jgi:hypothetical protein